jgi:hypothetical protein
LSLFLERFSYGERCEMRRKATFLNLILMVFLAINHAIANTPVEVTEIKNLGISDADETKCVIEIQWKINPALHPNHSVFNITLEIIYADEAILIFDEQAANSSRSAQIEVPALHLFRGGKPAIIKEIKGFITTEVTQASCLPSREHLARG